MSADQNGSTLSGAWASAPRLGVVELLALVWRERALAALICAAFVALGAIAGFLQKTEYKAESRVLVRLGQEYVYQPKVGAAGAGATPKLEEVMQSELKLIASSEVARAVMTQLGPASLFPDLADAGDKERQMQDAVRAFQRRLKAESAPQTPIIALSFKHENPATAAKALNAYVDAYLKFRQTILLDPATTAFDKEGEALQSRLSDTSAALAKLLADNGIGDFDAERRGVSDLQARLESDLVIAAAERRALDGQVAALRTRIAQQTEQIDIFTESDAERVLVQLQLERAQLAAKYQPGVGPLLEVERRIVELEAFLKGGARPSLTRRGPNPVRQELEGQMFSLEAQASAAQARGAALTKAREDAQARALKLQALEPQVRALTRHAGILEENAHAFGLRAEEARALTALAPVASDNIRVIERAAAPSRGSSLRLELMAAGLLVGVALGALAALLSGLSRDRFPTARSAAATLGAPVIGVGNVTPMRTKARTAA
ncbi:MAG: GumC family protein [Caulobacterales bacterium]